MSTDTREEELGQVEAAEKAIHGVYGKPYIVKNPLPFPEGRLVLCMSQEQKYLGRDAGMDVSRAVFWPRSVLSRSGKRGFSSHQNTCTHPLGD